MKNYLIFVNEPRAVINEYTAGNKRDALKMNNSEHGTNNKIKKRGMLLIVEKSAWYHYDFRKISYAN